MNRDGKAKRKKKKIALEEAFTNIDTFTKEYDGLPYDPEGVFHIQPDHQWADIQDSHSNIVVQVCHMRQVR